MSPPPPRFSPFLPLLLLALNAASCTHGAPGSGSTPLPAPDNGPLDDGPLRLGPGDVAELRVSADGHAAERLATPAGNERFVLILASTRLDARAPASPYRVSLEHTPAASTHSTLHSKLLSGCSLSSERFASSALPTDPAPTGTPPLEGATRSLLIPARAETQSITARALSVGEHAVIWADTTHPTTLDQAFVSQFRDDFERVILPRARQVFGTEPDVDHDGRIQLVFTRLTRERGVAFFSSCDLNERLEGCHGGNRGEYLYLTPPDAIDPPYNTPNAIKEILAHEVAHLLHFQRKVLRNQLNGWEDGAYLCEGIGALSQDVTGFQAGNLYVTRAALDAIDQFSLGDVLHGAEPDRSREGVLRGGAYLFVRYLYDRAGGDVANALQIENRGGPSLLRALLDAPVWVDQALPRVTSSNTADLALDFYTALALSNREDAASDNTASGHTASAETPPALATNPCFRYLPTSLDPITKKQRGANLFARFHGSQMQGPRLLPVREKGLREKGLREKELREKELREKEPNAAPDSRLRAGGVQYLSVDAAPGSAELSVAIRLDPQSAARVRIARIQ